MVSYEIHASLNSWQVLQFVWMMIQSNASTQSFFIEFVSYFFKVGLALRMDFYY